MRLPCLSACPLFALVQALVLAPKDNAHGVLFVQPALLVVRSLVLHRVQLVLHEHFEKDPSHHTPLHTAQRRHAIPDAVDGAVEVAMGLTRTLNDLRERRLLVRLLIAGNGLVRVHEPPKPLVARNEFLPFGNLLGRHGLFDTVIR